LKRTKPHYRWLCPLLGFILARALDAAPTATVERLLAGRPSDPVTVKEHLKAAMARKSYEDAFVLARYLHDIQGVDTLKLHVVLAELGERLKRTAEAQRYASEALRLDSGDTRARGVLGRLASGRPATPDTIPTVRPSVSLRPDFLEARRYYYEDRFDRALGAVNRILTNVRSDLEALLLKAQILEARMEIDQATDILLEITRLHPDDPRAFLRLGELAFRQYRYGNLREHLVVATTYYEKASSLAPNDIPTLLSLASFHYSSEQTELGDRYYRKVRGHRPFEERDMVLTDASILFTRGRYQDSLDQISYYSRTFGTDSQSLLTEGLVRLKLGQKDEGGECLEQAFRRNPQNLAAIMRIVPVLVTMDQSERALKVISAAEAAYPESSHVASLKRQIKLRVVTDKDLVTRTRGPFAYTYPKWLETRKPEVLESIQSIFDRAYVGVGALFECRPRAVKVRIVLDTGLDNPAFYSPETGIITISAQWFFEGDKKTKGQPSPEVMRATAAHMIRHEYSHFVFAQKLGSVGRPKSGGSVPLWLMEGIADWSAGGLAVLAATGKNVKGYFDNGFIDQKALDHAMLVTNGAKDPTQNQKAYVQSFFMVKYLLALGSPSVGEVRATLDGTDTIQASDTEKAERNGLTRLMKFAGHLHEGTGDLESSLKSCYGLTSDEFCAGWQRLLRRDVIDSPTPRLATRD